jgi:hypothetical protein
VYSCFCKHDDDGCGGGDDGDDGDEGDDDDGDDDGGDDDDDNGYDDDDYDDGYDDDVDDNKTSLPHRLPALPSHAKAQAQRLARHAPSLADLHRARLCPPLLHRVQLGTTPTWRHLSGVVWAPCLSMRRLRSTV